MIWLVVFGALVAAFLAGMLLDRAIVRRSEDAEVYEDAPVALLPGVHAAAVEAGDTGVLPLPVGGDLDGVRLPSAVERAAMYDTLTNDPPGPVLASAAPHRAGGHQAHYSVGRCWCDDFHRDQATTLALTEPPGRLARPRPQRAGTGRADRRDYHKHRGPYAAGGERHVTLAQAEQEAAELRHQWHDDAMRREFSEWEAEMDGIIDGAYQWLATL